jgi:hypothetical protein
MLGWLLAAGAEGVCAGVFEESAGVGMEAELNASEEKVIELTTEGSS